MLACELVSGFASVLRMTWSVAVAGQSVRAFRSWVMLTAVALPVRISVVGCAPAHGRWRVSWLIANLSDEALLLQDAWIPHGRFRGEGHVGIGAHVPAGGSYLLDLNVSASERDGTVVENAFLILRVRGANAAWRVFARMRVEFSEASVQPVVEAVTAQRL